LKAFGWADENLPKAKHFITDYSVDDDGTLYKGTHRKGKNKLLA
jgi:hypothetical protein